MFDNAAYKSLIPLVTLSLLSVPSPFISHQMIVEDYFVYDLLVPYSGYLVSPVFLYIMKLGGYRIMNGKVLPGQIYTISLIIIIIPT